MGVDIEFERVRETLKAASYPVAIEGDAGADEGEHSALAQQRPTASGEDGAAKQRGCVVLHVAYTLKKVKANAS